MQLTEECGEWAERKIKFCRLLNADLKARPPSTSEVSWEDQSREPLREALLESILLTIGIKEGMRESEILDCAMEFLRDLFFRWTEFSACGRWDILKESDSAGVQGCAEAEGADLLAFARVFVGDPDRLEYVVQAKMHYEQPPFPWVEYWRNSILKVLGLDGKTNTLEGVRAIRKLAREVLTYWRHWHTTNDNSDTADWGGETKFYFERGVGSSGES